jgi:hypothetical protein
MSTPEQPELGPWATAMQDQAQAAVRTGDWESLARTVVEGQQHAAAMDAAEGTDTLRLDYWTKLMVQMDHQLACLIAGEAMRRLHERISRERSD